MPARRTFLGLALAVPALAATTALAGGPKTRPRLRRPADSASTDKESSEPTVAENSAPCAAGETRCKEK